MEPTLRHESTPPACKGIITLAMLLFVSSFFVANALIGFSLREPFDLFTRYGIPGGTFTGDALYCAVAIVGAQQRYFRNGELARYIGVSTMTLSRWKKNPTLNTPSPMEVNGIERNDRELWDAWLKARAVSRIQRDQPPRDELPASPEP